MIACAPTVESEAEISAEASAGGPFFSGPNSLIAEQEGDLQSMVKDNEIAAEQLEEVKLRSVSVTLRPSDSISLEAFENASLSIVSPDLEMISFATLNPIESDGQRIELSVSQEADLAAYFKGESYSLVLDLGFVEDLYLDRIGATIDMKLNLKYKE